MIRSIVRDADKDNDRFRVDPDGDHQERTVSDADGKQVEESQMTFITKKFIPRRTFLRGAGVTLGLPLLDSMVPAQTPLRKTAAAPVRRFLGIWHPHGAAPGYWSPAAGRHEFRVLLHHQAA